MSAVPVSLTPKWYTVAQVAKLLGYGESKVRMLIFAGDLRSLKDGRSRRVLPALTAWVNDRTVKQRIESALGLLLSQGRAVGVVVVGAIQDPRKDVLPQRDLFPIRIGLRLNEAEHIDLTLGRAARLRGAACDMIPDTLPGVGYVQVDGITEPVRVRFAHHTDADLAALGNTDRPALTVIEGGAA